MLSREVFLEKLRREIEAENHLIAVASGTGLTAKYAIQGGADFLLALNSGIFRGMGRGSLGGLLPYANSNDMVYEFGIRELIPLVGDFPVVFGLNATDPTRDMAAYLDEIRQSGFIGINNYPTIGLIDGKFREALEENGSAFEHEVEVFRMAHERGMVTVAFVFDENQAGAMLDAGTDILCVHLGLTQGGMLGAAKALSLVASKDRIEAIYALCDQQRPEVIKMLYGGPVKTPVDVQYMYQNTSAHGYIGGSAFDRIPTEKSLMNITKAFKTTDDIDESDLMSKMLNGITKYYDYTGFIKEYVKENYMNEISFLDLAKVCHVSRSHLSALFKKEVGCSFPEYLVNFRIHKAAKLLKEENLRVSEVAELVGYQDVAHFSKIFKKYMGVSPKTVKHKT
ncbi:phosphoenolpyruvate hydrolase family protein [Eubacterium limosum]|uniref:Phosphoenolpyruvate hydrolase family protein n=1 Tax=Eubacterium limosum TaxID=1736 RepID=A0ABT5UQS3_EUBLI|nr:phosphoenolpyruvate hydrolase family protein [Eubacterium limosum]MCB6570613.1 phosphoenolpyruvate hydrolase family protein [Eubacterium limosum]MDE1471221.1 phosphoenolpyruvate hydrolase family protein [Eubacterium limosum]